MTEPATTEHRTSGVQRVTVTTLTTLGYGDIMPVHPIARSLSNIEAIIGQVYPATLLARLVSLGGGPARG